jgi:antitoxin VapB
MALNIKNETTYRLARQLSRLTGESLTAAITKALQERLERLQTPAAQEAMVSDLLSLGQDCAHRLKQPYNTVEHGELLYDERGLPK